MLFRSEVFEYSDQGQRVYEDVRVVKNIFDKLAVEEMRYLRSQVLFESAQPFLTALFGVPFPGSHHKGASSPTSRLCSRSGFRKGHEAPTRAIRTGNPADPLIKECLGKQQDPKAKLFRLSIVSRGDCHLSAMVKA